MFLNFKNRDEQVSHNGAAKFNVDETSDLVDRPGHRYTLNPVEMYLYFQLQNIYCYNLISINTYKTQYILLSLVDVFFADQANEFARIIIPFARNYRSMPRGCEQLSTMERSIEKIRRDFVAPDTKL